MKSKVSYKLFSATSAPCKFREFLAKVLWEIDHRDTFKEKGSGGNRTIIFYGARVNIKGNYEIICRTAPNEGKDLGAPCRVFTCKTNYDFVSCYPSNGGKEYWDSDIKPLFNRKKMRRLLRMAVEEEAQQQDSHGLKI